MDYSHPGIGLVHQPEAQCHLSKAKSSKRIGCHRLRDCRPTPCRGTGWVHVYCPMTPSPAGVHALLAGAHRSLPYELSHVSALTRYLGHCPLECCRAALSMCMSPLGFDKAADTVQRWCSCGSLKRCELCAESTLRTRSCRCRLHGRWSWSH